MNAEGKSDRPIVPVTPANNGGAEGTGRAERAGPPAESDEERGRARRNTVESNPGRTQSRNDCGSSGLDRVRDAAQRSCEVRFTALLHHIDVSLLRESFHRLRKSAAAGVDGVTWREYEQGLEDRLVDLHGRLHRGAFRVQPSLRGRIDKADGSQRELGMPSLEDKLVQHAVSTVLQAIFEEDFLGFSYGFRPSRSPHQALDALNVGITEQRVNWVLDADIKSFFDHIDRDWLMQFLEQRVGDQRVLRLIRKWLDAGIIEDTEWSDSGKGTPQGGVLSPLLANVFLHHVLDVWIDSWRKHHARGRVIVVRYADDFVLGFEHEEDARNCWAALRERLQRFGLSLHPDKTRLIEFGRGSAANRKREGRGRCETFDFLGFTHYCGETRRAKRFVVKRKTMASRMRRTLAAIQHQLQRRRHHPLGQTGRWLARVVRGWRGYHAVPFNFDRLEQFDQAVKNLWLRQIRRRSQRGKSRWTWARLGRLWQRHIEPPKILHAYPNTRHRARLRAGAG